MAWGCENGHEVREGMFRCPVCGSDRVGEQAELAATSPQRVTARQSLRQDARRQLSSRIGTGAVLVVAGSGLSLMAASNASPEGDTGASVLSVLAYLATVVGACLVLIGLVGHGVRLGIEASDTGD